MKLTNGKPNGIFEEAREFCAKLESLAAAEEHALRHMKLAEDAVAEAKRNFADASAQALARTRNGHLPSLPEEAKLAKARATLEQCELTVLGAQRQQKALDIEALTLREKLRAAVAEHRSRITAQFLKENAEVIASYASFLRQGRALADALAAKIPDPKHPDDPFALALLNLPAPGDWQSDPAAKALHVEHSGPATSLATIERLSRQAESRALVRNRFLPPGTPIPQPRDRFVIKHTLKIGTTVYRPGDVISAFIIPGNDAKLLAQLAYVGKIRPISAADEVNRSESK